MNIKKAVIIFCIMQLFVQLFPQSFNDYFDKAKELYKKKDYENALININEAIAIQPSYASCYYNRGLIYTKLLKNDLALEDFNKAIGLNDKNPSYYHSRGNVYKAQKEYGKAVTDFDKSIELDESYYKAYVNKAQIKYYLNDFKNALSLYDKAAKNQPADAYIYFFKLFVSFQYNRSVDKEILKLIEEKKDMFNDWQLVITDLFLDKITPEQALEKAKGDEEFCEIYFYIAMKYLFNGQNDRAKEYYQKCVDTHVRSFLEYQFAEFELNKK